MPKKRKRKTMKKTNFQNISEYLQAEKNLIIGVIGFHAQGDMKKAVKVFSRPYRKLLAGIKEENVQAWFDDTRPKGAGNPTNAYGQLYAGLQQANKQVLAIFANRKNIKGDIVDHVLSLETSEKWKRLFDTDLINEKYLDKKIKLSEGERLKQLKLLKELIERLPKDLCMLPVPVSNVGVQVAAGDVNRILRSQEELENRLRTLFRLKGLGIKEAIESRIAICALTFEARGDPDKIAEAATRQPLTGTKFLSSMSDQFIYEEDKLKKRAKPTVKVLNFYQKAGNKLITIIVVTGTDLADSEIMKETSFNTGFFMIPVRDIGVIVSSADLHNRFERAWDAILEVNKMLMDKKYKFVHDRLEKLLYRKKDKAFEAEAERISKYKEYDKLMMSEVDAGLELRKKLK